MDIDIKWGRTRGIVIAMLVGRFSGANSDLFERLLENGVDPSDKALILDFEHVTFLSSAGLRVSLAVAKKFTAPGRKFAVCSLQEAVRGIVEVSGFDKVIPLYDSQAAALEALEKD